MALFSSSRREGQPAGSSQEAALTIIARDLRVEGWLTSSGVIKIEGTVVGTVRAERQVLVAKGGTVEGDICTPEAIVDGEVRGSILAGERVEVQASAVIQGDVTTPRLGVAEGAVVCGHIDVGVPKAVPGPSAEKPPTLAHKEEPPRLMKLRARD